jgi:hypothetical protein
MRSPESLLIPERDFGISPVRVLGHQVLGETLVDEHLLDASDFVFSSAGGIVDRPGEC